MSHRPRKKPIDPMVDSTAIREYGRRRRKESGITQAEASGDLTQSAMSELETGQADSRFGTLRSYWRRIRLRVSLVFWRGNDIDWICEVGQMPERNASYLEAVRPVVGFSLPNAATTVRYKVVQVRRLSEPTPLMLALAEELCAE